MCFHLSILGKILSTVVRQATEGLVISWHEQAASGASQQAVFMSWRSTVVLWAVITHHVCASHHSLLFKMTLASLG